MTTFKRGQGSRSSSLYNMGTLASATYAASSAIDLGALQGLDTVFEVEADPNGSPTGNKQLVLFAKLSLDNSNFTSGPESGTDTTNEADLHWVGTLTCNDTGTHRDFFSIDHLPPCRYIKLIPKNDMGVALTSGNIYSAEITGDGS